MRIWLLGLFVGGWGGWGGGWMDGGWVGFVVVGFEGLNKHISYVIYFK